ncbi:glycosyltransferase family 2 protein [Xanthomarina gelatinilytica]|uniref:glycosyltransferase family 2 protein n=1 Tax=Xanthomarina gelatinilytica TaxID=1137281 RepID=UPI003AA7FC83
MVVNPLVSIVIPIFNRLDLLKNTLLSIEGQTFNSLEVLLIDDASETVFNIQELQDMLVGRSLRYHKLNKNQGPGKARSIGRALAKGQYVAYLDSDDEWEPTFLEETVAVLETHDAVSMVFTNVLIKRKHSSQKRLALTTGNYDFFDLIFNKKLYWATGAALWRSNISLAENWKSFRDHEDYVHDILSLLQAPQIYHLETPLCIVNKNDSLGIPRSNSDMLKSLLLLSRSKQIIKNLSKEKKKDEFVSFIVWRLYKRNYKIKDLKRLILLYYILINYTDDFKLFTITFIRLIKRKLNYFKI